MSEDNSWVFDSLVCFLHGPVWNAPLQTFIEEKSYFFDPNEKNDKNNPLYQKIFDEYKTLVDYMLGSFMDEMQITPEQFEIACLEGRHQHDNSFNFHQGLFQQIWAANDINIFIRMMTQRNIELQLQALDLIERRQNSLEAKSEDDPEINKIPEESIPEKIEEQQDVPKIVEAKVEVKDDQIETSKERLNLLFKNKEINPEDVQARQEYLRSQRDKILEIKKKARAKQLNDTTKRTGGGGGNGGRPSSAQAAQKILEGNNLKEVVQDSVINSASELRKTLAKRLKVEVVDQTQK